jgi:hypothetical protein
MEVVSELNSLAWMTRVIDGRLPCRKVPVNVDSRPDEEQQRKDDQ